MPFRYTVPYTQFAITPSKAHDYHPATLPDTQLILNRLDTIMRELESLRRQIIMPSPPPTNLTDQLFGSLGKGTWEEYELDFMK
ncbi:MAG: hypothetical protein IPL28_24775, partial [Chloroflexi bacterium]|nr:hypothetical protein [Chloroflexota bacterium]